MGTMDRIKLGFGIFGMLLGAGCIIAEHVTRKKNERIAESVRKGLQNNPGGQPIYAEGTVV